MESKVLAHRYQETAVRTASPMQLIVMLYDAAISSLQEAREHLRRKNIEGRIRSTNKCVAIISELQSSLNMKNGGDIAVSLDRLYNYMKQRIFTANIQQRSEPLQEIESLLDNLRSAWRKLAEQSKDTTEEPKQLELPKPSAVRAAAPVTAAQTKSFNISI